MSDVSATFEAVDSCAYGTPCHGVRYNGITTMKTDENANTYWIIDTSFKLYGPLFPRDLDQALVIYWVSEVNDPMFPDIKSELAMNRWGNYSETTQ
jgi:hypothetical protein